MVRSLLGCILGLGISIAITFPILQMFGLKLFLAASLAFGVPLAIRLAWELESEKSASGTRRCHPKWNHCLRCERCVGRGQRWVPLSNNTGMVKLVCSDCFGYGWQQNAQAMSYAK